MTRNGDRKAVETSTDFASLENEAGRYVGSHWAIQSRIKNKTQA